MKRRVVIPLTLAVVLLGGGALVGTATADETAAADGVNPCLLMFSDPPRSYVGSGKAGWGDLFDGDPEYTYSIQVRATRTTSHSVTVTTVRTCPPLQMGKYLESARRLDAQALDAIRAGDLDRLTLNGYEGEEFAAKVERVYKKALRQAINGVPKI